MSIPEDIYTNILINFNNIYDNCLISKSIEKKRQEKIQNAIKIINKYIYKYIVEMRIYIDYDFYLIPKILYKKFYPLNMRKEFIVTLINNNTNIITQYQKKLYNNIINKKSLVSNFNKIIDSLDENLLFNIGW